MDRIQHAVSKLSLKDPEGGSISFGELYADQTTVLVFLRHFG